MTGLPGNRAIRDYVQNAILDGDQARYFCYCDFDDFKPFNDTYGFQKGDLAITLFAALLRRHFIGEEKFLGHVGATISSSASTAVPRRISGASFHA